MFMLKASILEGATLRPMGYKILLEVLAKANYRTVVEVPYMFGPRDCGTSKLGTRQTFEYFLHLAQLAFATGQFKTWFCYATVGFTGASVHLAILMRLIARQHVPLAMALLISTQIALLNNFVLNRFFTFRRLPRSKFVDGEQLIVGLVRYQGVCLPGAVLNSFLTMLLVWYGCPLLAAASAGVVLGGAWNLLFNVPAIWRSAIPKSEFPALAVPGSKASLS
jgi:dolichol-phosphate mannosyltransferase